MQDANFDKMETDRISAIINSFTDLLFNEIEGQVEEAGGPTDWKNQNPLFIAGMIRAQADMLDTAVRTGQGPDMIRAITTQIGVRTVQLAYLKGGL